MWLGIALTLAIVIPISPLLYRIAFRPLADASVLVLLIVAVAVHFAISGLALLYFGPEGFRTEPMTRAFFDLGPINVSGQSILIVASSAIFSFLLFLFFEHTLTGKALRATAVNRVGARLVGILPSTTGATAFLLASALAGISGILIGPVTTLYYDSGFLIGLKAFVGAIIGGLVSYPATAVGAIFVGLFESYAAFWNSALKEVLVFGALIPILIWQSLDVGRAMSRRKSRRKSARARRDALEAHILLGLAIAFIAVAPAIFGSFTITLMNYIGIYAFAALGLVLLTGVGGLTSFGQAAFVGIGAYATAWYTAVHGGSPWIGLLLALVLHRARRHRSRRRDAAARRPLPAAEHDRLGHRDLFPVRKYRCAGPLQRAVRHSGDHDRADLARRQHRDVLLHLGAARHRHAAVPEPARTRARAAPSAACAAASPWWKASRSISFAMRLAVFVLAGLLAGLSGWLYAHMQRYVSPAPFDIRPGIELLLMALVGGAGHIAGAVVGAAIVTLLKNVLQDVLPAFTRYSAQLEIVRVRRAVHRPAAEGARRRRADVQSLSAAPQPWLLPAQAQPLALPRAARRLPVAPC